MQIYTTTINLHNYFNIYIYFCQRQKSSIFTMEEEKTLSIAFKSIPSSWDYFFSKQVTCFIIIKMKNGTIMAGYYGVNSFSSSSIDERDIYVEKGFYMDENSNWNKDDESIGFYVNSKDIDSIEFKQVKIKEAQNE